MYGSSLTLAALAYFCINHDYQIVYHHFEIIIKVLFRIHLNNNMVAYGSTAIINIFTLITARGSTLGVRI